MCIKLDWVKHKTLSSMFRPCRVQQKQEGTAICVFVTKHKAIIEVITDRYMHTHIYYLNLCFDRSLTAKSYALENETGMNTLSMNNFFKFPNFLKPYWVEYDKKQSQCELLVLLRLYEVCQTKRRNRFWSRVSIEWIISQDEI